MKLIKLVKSENPTKKYDAYVQHGDHVKKISFGAAGISTGKAIAMAIVFG